MQYFSNPVSQPNLWCFIKLPLPREYISKLSFLMLGHCVNETVCFRVRDYVWIFTFLAKCIVLAVTKLWGRRRRVFLPRFGERWTCITQGVCWIWDEKCNLLEERSNVFSFSGMCVWSWWWGFLWIGGVEEQLGRWALLTFICTLSHFLKKFKTFVASPTSRVLLRYSNWRYMNKCTIKSLC